MTLRCEHRHVHQPGRQVRQEDDVEVADAKVVQRSVAGEGLAQVAARPLVVQLPARGELVTLKRASREGGGPGGAEDGQEQEDTGEHEKDADCLAHRLTVNDRARCG